MITYPLGFVLFLWSGFDKSSKLPLFVKVPIYLSLGLSLSSLLLLIIGFIVIDWYPIIALFFFSLTVAIYYHKKRAGTGKEDTRFKALSNIIPLTLFAITFLHFSMVAGFFGWPPAGDAIEHGLFTSLLLFNKKIQLTLTPLAPLKPIENPPGFHILAANLSLLTGLLPGEAVFLMAATSLILIPPLLYSLTYILTRSNTVSVLAFLSAFTIYGNLERWLVGYLYNGPYSNLFGFLDLVLFCNLVAINKYCLTEEAPLTRSRIPNLLTFMHIIVTYTNFAIFPLTYAISRLSKKSLETIPKTLRSKSILMVLFIFLFSVFFVSWNSINKVMWVAYMIAGKLYGRLGYKVLSMGLGDAPLFVAMLIAIYFLAKRIYTNTSIFYLIVLLPILASLPDELYPYFSLILPRRSLIIATLLSWVLISIFIHHLTSKFKSKVIRVDLGLAHKASFGHRIRVTEFMIITIITFAIFMPNLVSHFTFEQAEHYSWHPRSKYFRNDYNVLLWIHENVKPDELILNDYSYTSQFLLSFSLKNVTCSYHLNSPYEVDRAIDAQKFWEDPANSTLFLYLTKKYDIKYVLLTSEGRYDDWVGIGGDNVYKEKPFKVEQYKIILDDHPFLKLLFESGQNGVYKVYNI